MTFEECFSAENLLRVHKRCRCGKAHKKEVVSFELNLGENLVKLSREINKNYTVSKYKRFMVYEPKPRVIEALPYRDRLVQMALCEGIIAPTMEKRLVFDNAACRKGKGTSFAIKRLHKFLNAFFVNCGIKGYFLKIDISKYFASIDHNILKVKLKKVGFESDAFSLMCKFIDSCGDEKGLPLGNQTSQWFALLYLDALDRFIKEKLRIKFYVRYMDDLILICKDKFLLQDCKRQIADFCEKELKLCLNSKTQIGRIADGIDFLGFNHILLKNGKILIKLRQASKYRIKHKIKFLEKSKNKSFLENEDFLKRINSYVAFLKQSDSFFWFKNFFLSLPNL